ncbi:MAG: DUF4149 domain-containing protein [Myxococcales bacterium]|nr:DUF4149 domain-containing protein [Myxococcales bacterium]
MARVARAADGLLAFCLGSWLGSALFFTVAVAPAIFSMADEPGEAGAAIGDILAVLHIGGACFFTLAAALAWVLRRSAWLRFGPIVLAALCLVSHFGVSGPMAELRERPAELRTAVDQESQRKLHRISVLLFSAVGIGNVVLLYQFGRPINGSFSTRSNPRIS